MQSIISFMDVVKVEKFINTVKNKKEDCTKDLFKKYNMNINIFLEVTSRYSAGKDNIELRDYLINLDYLTDKETILLGIDNYIESQAIYNYLSTEPEWLIDSLVASII